MPRLLLTLAALCLCSQHLGAEEGAPFDAAIAFGARPSVSHLRMSPDGMSVAWIAPTTGQGSAVYTMNLAKDSKAKVVLTANGKPERLSACAWVSNERLVCTVGWLQRDAMFGVMPFSRVVAVNIDGTNLQLLSKRDKPYAPGVQLHGGEIIDWLPETDGSVLMTRAYLPDDRGTRTASNDEGLGVDQVDTRNLRSHRVEMPRRDAWDYISDGHGRVRILAMGAHNNRDESSGVVNFLYHPAAGQEWQPLSRYHLLDHTGFLPEAVDSDLNIAYGYKRQDGRTAIYSLALDGSLKEQLVYANAEVDVDALIRIGRANRVVGATYITEYPHAVYFAPDVKALIESLSRALKPATPRVVDASADESRMLVLTSTDKDPGVYYVFDRKSQRLQTFLVVRSQLEGIKLAAVKPITYRAADGTDIPGYLTLPPGVDIAQGLPALVMPHGGPGARDVWGFNWVAQFFAARGYAVLQPNFRGSAGYGEQWFQKNGFRSWQTAIGDVLDGGRWLVKEGIADPRKLGIVGWSYGGYAALQSAVVDPTLFKAVIAIAPVTDLNQIKQEHRYWTDVEIVNAYVGDGPHMHEGSPAEHADRFRVPVLLFHGEMDRNVSVEESRLMATRLKRAAVSCELVTWPDLDHSLDDSSARAQMLSRSDSFLRAAFGM